MIPQSKIMTSELHDRSVYIYILKKHGFCSAEATHTSLHFVWIKGIGRKGTDYGGIRKGTISFVLTKNLEQRDLEGRD